MKYMRILECLCFFTASVTLAQPAEKFTLFQNAPHLDALMKRELSQGVRSIPEVDDLISELQTLEREAGFKQVKNSLETAQRLFERQKTCLSAVEKFASESAGSEAAMEDSFGSMLSRQRDACLDYGRQGLESLMAAYRQIRSDSAKSDSESPVIEPASPVSTVSSVSDESLSSTQAELLF
jgi:hypothetical protein